jgi:hypothetical protein
MCKPEVRTFSGFKGRVYSKHSCLMSFPLYKCIVISNGSAFGYSIENVIRT